METRTKYFTNNLEQEARDLVISPRNFLHNSNNSNNTNGFSLTTLLEQEVSFTLEQIDRLRSLHKYQKQSLLKTETYVDTGLMQMEERTPRYSTERFPEREKFYQRLFVIEAERRKQSVFYEHQMQNLQKRLLSVMQKHEQLTVRNTFKEMGKYVRL